MKAASLALEETICAPASPPGAAAAGLIRLSGPATRSALRAALTSSVPERPGAHRAQLRLFSRFTVPAQLLLFRAPRSYTGQDAAELLVPGAAAALQETLRRLLATPGVRLAQPGEFTLRALLLGRLSVAQAMGVAATIAAQNEEELACAQRLLSGKAEETAARARNTLLEALALVEAEADFADQEDVALVQPASLAKALEDCETMLQHERGNATSDPGCAAARVALVGPPNAGKSTLFNALLGRRRAVTSPLPGATRDALEELLDLRDATPLAPPCLLIDLAGLDAAWSPCGDADAHAQRRAVEVVRGAHVLLHCDPSGRFAQLPGQRPAHRIIRVRTKADLLEDADAGGAGEAIAVCALDGWRLDALKRAVADACAHVAGASGLARVAPRFAQAIDEALQSLREARSLLQGSAAPRVEPLELVAQLLRDAADALAPLTGQTTPDDVLGRIFSTFCIGK
ncbi:MAG: hypothetical protein D6824_03065 [Planctomycetota bacterium]|nr:MAG: hypothetical protein D6824_03065 [Planctomycetota bacterium]